MAHVARDRTYSGCISMVIHNTLVPRLRVTDMQGRHIPIQKYLMRLDGAVSLHNIYACFASKHNLTYPKKCVWYLRHFTFLGFSFGTSVISCQSLLRQRSLFSFVYHLYYIVQVLTQSLHVLQKPIFHCEYTYIYAALHRHRTAHTLYCTYSILYRHWLYVHRNAHSLYGTDSELHRHYTAHILRVHCTDNILYMHRNAHNLYGTDTELHRY